MTSLIVTTKSKIRATGLKQQFLLLLSLVCLLFLALTPQTIYAQCSAISSINFAANNPADPDVYFGDGSNAYILESLEPKDYECFDVVPFLVELEIAADAGCDDYVVELPLQWLCNTTGQGGIGVTALIDYQINPSSDPGSANLDGDEAIELVTGYPETDGTALETPNGSCEFNALFRVSGLDPGDKVIVRVDVMLDCDLTSSPTGNIQANLGTFQNIKILSGVGSNCGCNNLQGGAQTIPWKVGLPECAIACTITKNQDVSCNGGSDGSATVNVTGAYGTVTYAWPGGQTTATVSNLQAGTYEVTVSDEIIDCNSTCMVTIGQPPALSCSITKTSDVSCNGLSDGSATISGAGGTPPYSFNWGGADPTALAAGSYTATVTDANNCMSTCSVTILEPPTLTCSITKTSDVSCNGLSDGSATISGAGGTPPYSFDWGGADPTALAAGSYTATVTDANNCMSTCSVTILEPPLLTCSITKTSDVSCNGFSDGSATISGAGGTPPYSFDWGGADPNALAAGSYTATVTDANNCMSTCSVTILEPPVLTCSITKTSDVSCNGFSDGSATISGAGGTPPYSFDWGGANPNALAAGSYTATVTDANGCTSTCSVTITEPPALSCSIVKTSDVSCYGFSDGSATISGAGGTPPYSFNWGGANPNALAAGSYTATVTDANGCTSTCDVTINQPPLLTCSITKTSDASCNGFNDGSATISGAGGTPPYSFDWGGADPNALAAGSYTATVTDANGCTSTCDVTIGQPSDLSCSITKTSDVSCYGFSDGSATISAAGGTAPYSFDWGGADPNALAAGSYTATVTDANGCTSTCSVTITEPPALSCTITKTSDVSCYGFSDGSATISGSGGTTPYSFNWGGANPNALAAGTYIATVTDANGCTSTCEVTITEPPALSCTITKTSDVSCFGFSDGSATISAAGGTAPYSFDWGGADPNALAAGSYTATVTDANGCTSTCSVTITQPPVLSCSISKTSDVSCYGFSDGSATVSGNGGTTPYSFDWGGKNPNALPAGTHTVTVTDANNCTSTCSVTINQPPPLSCSIINNSGVSEICLGESLDLSAGPSGGTPPYTYDWSSDGSANFSSPASSSTMVFGFGLGTETITLEVTDANGCVTTCTIDITTVRCVDECTWTPGFWKNHPEEICGLLGGNVTKIKGQRTCSGESQNIGFILCGTHYTLSASEISCLFNYSSSTRGRKTPPGCTPEVVAIAEHFAPYPNGETLLHHILAAKLNLIYNGASFGNVDVGDLICVDEVNGVNVPNIFNGTPDASANEICAINFCLNGATSASQLSAYIKPLTAFNECNNTCGLPSQNPFLAIPQFTERVNTEMRVFPNPAKDQVNLQFNLDADRQISIRVMDLNGKLYRTMQIDAMQGMNTETIDLNGLSSGLYLIQFTDGDQVQTKRFVRTE